MADSTDTLEEIKANQQRLELGLNVVSEMVERLLAQVEAVGFDRTQLKFRGYQPEISGNVQAVRRFGKENTGGTGTSYESGKADGYWKVTP